VLGDPVANVNHEDQQLDSDDEMETRMANVYPLNFLGVVSENADAWLKQLINYCEYKAYDGDKTKALFKVLLTECAAVWFESLEVAIQNDWTQLKAAFLAHHATPEFMKYKHANELFNSKQGDRSVDDFCAYMQNLAREVNADDHMLRYALLNGLRSDIKNHVIRSQPTTWKDLVDVAKVGEMCVPETTTTGSSLTIQLELIQDQLKELSAQKSHSDSLGRSTDKPPRSPSPRRVRFDDRVNDRVSWSRGGNDRGGDYSDYVNRHGDSVSRSRYYDRLRSPHSDFNFCGRGTCQGYRNNRLMAPPSRQWRNDNYQYQPQDRPQRGRGAFRGTARPYCRENACGRPWSGFYGDEQCGNCGRQRHTHPNLCPAINQECRGCGKKDHFLKVCHTHFCVGLLAWLALSVAHALSALGLASFR